MFGAISILVVKLNGIVFVRLLKELLFAIQLVLFELRHNATECE